MTRHVSAAAIARFREGDLGPRRAARVGAHLGRCARCTDLSAELAGITKLLASTQAPAMPERLATRIQDTLAAEAARRVALDPGTEPGRRDLPGRAGPPRRRRRPLASPVAVRALAAAGAIALLAGGGYLVFGRNTPSTSAGSATSGAAPLAGAGGQHAAANQPAMGVPAAGPRLTYRDGRASFVPVVSGVNYLPATLTEQVAAALSQVRSAQVVPSPAATAVPSAPAAGSAGSGLSLFGGLTVRALQGCVGRIAPRGRVLLVDVARYQGRQATVIVVAPEGAAARQVWVAGPACSAARGDILAHRSMPGG
jgi:hypothetical protein